MFIEIDIFSLLSWFSHYWGKNNNTLVSGNAGDEKNLHPDDFKNCFYQINWIFFYIWKATLTVLFFFEKQRALYFIVWVGKNVNSNE